jgi:hypothetical protein
MSTDSEDYGVPLGTWYRLVRRARIGDARKKSAALVIASYADTDGTSVKCGIARLAVDCEMGYSTARRYLAWLREVGLIELVRLGNRKAKRADEYRLTIGPDTEKALNVLDEGEYRELVDGMKATNRVGEKGRRLRSDKVSAETGDADTGAAHLSALTHEVSAEPRDSDGSDDDPSALTLSERRSGYLRSPMGEPPPPSKRSPPTGGAPPPDPRRPEPPPSSGSRLESEQEISAAHHPAQDLQRNSRPHTRAASDARQAGGLVVDFFTREAM